MTPIAAPPADTLAALRAVLDETRTRARLHWKTCWAQRFTGRFCTACWEWDQEDLRAEKALKRAEARLRRAEARR